MTIKYLPSQMLKKYAPKTKVENLITNRLTLNRAVLSTLSDVDFLSKKTVETTALKVIKNYKERFKEEPEVKAEVMEDEKQLVSRVQNQVVFEIAAEIKDQYLGEYYKWLPSDAEVPDPIHQLKWGRKYQIGKGEMPGERYGCRCGMSILVPENKFEL